MLVVPLEGIPDGGDGGCGGGMGGSSGLVTAGGETGVVVEGFRSAINRAVRMRARVATKIEPMSTQFFGLVFVSRLRLVGLASRGMRLVG